MGQAKRRGSYEERKAEAVAREAARREEARLREAARRAAMTPEELERERRGRAKVSSILALTAMMGMAGRRGARWW